MAFSVQAIRYGWVALASLGVLTGTTIYVANNQRHQVKPQDIIEIALGTYERCLATQTSTNPTYSVTPPSFVRTWTSNVYTTNGVAVYTNIVTNTIGWHIDRDMMVSLDATIKALVPYYCDTNSVYDGSTNIVMLTVTGLWASLGIGDRTNKFTREQAWTNPVSTNWIVNYTSYWPSTNGTAVNICYTSDYQQVVNYAQSWTATGGHVWVTSSNWASEVVTVTNATTYGDYPWQIYPEDLQERYKVLNAMQYKIYDGSYSVSNNYDFGEVLDVNVGNVQADYAEAQGLCEASNSYSSATLSGMNSHTLGGIWNTYYPSGESVAVRKSVWKNTVLTIPFLFDFSTIMKSYIKIGNYSGQNWGGYPPNTNDFDANGSPGIKNVYTLWGTSSTAVSNVITINFDVSGDSTWFSIPASPPFVLARGFSFVSQILLLEPQFNYCTVKYW